MQQISYIYHYDQLTWIPGIMQHAFYEIQVEYASRPAFLDWLTTNCMDKIYVWSGCISPTPGQMSNWGHMIAPDEVTAFLIFQEAQDESRFCLEFLGAPTGIKVTLHKNGNHAYHSRRQA